MRSALFIVAALLLGLVTMIARAGVLTFMTDVISTSAPDTEATHTIQFTVTTDIPASGHIVLTVDPGNFTIPASFDYTDVDLQVSDSGGPFVDRDLAAVADASNDGVAIASPPNGLVDITLNSTTGIPAGDVVRILLGTNATFGAVGTDNIVNPTNPISYRITFQTTDSAGDEIDHGATMIAVVLPVTLGGGIPVVAPVRSNGLPSGLIAANNVNIELSLQTDILARCRYATSTGVLYQNMTANFNPDFGTTFWVNTSGYQNNTTYTFYVRCAAFSSGFANDDDFPISFTLKPTPINNTSIESDGFVTSGPTGNLGSGGVGNIPNGSSVLYLSSVTFSGSTIPGSSITVLTDGIKAGSIRAKDDGTFSTALTGLERGAYGFQLYTQDSRGLTSSLYGTTLSVAQGTDNDITSIVIPPTIQLSSDTAQPGDTITLSGGASPNSTVLVTISGQSGSASSGKPRTVTASSSPSGDWSVPLDTTQYAKGTYSAQAIAIVSDTSKSGPSKSAIFSVGTATPSSCGQPDMNGDGKVNLVDFSIFLLSWNTTNAAADFNCDGEVNLADFSIMLFGWTG
jgi:hypothetical protein